MQIRRQPKVIVPAMIEALRDKAPEVRLAAASGLANLRQEPALTAPALTSALGDSNRLVRARAALGEPLAARIEVRDLPLGARM